MVSEDLWYKAIGEIFHPKYKPVQNNDLAQYILTHTMTGPSVFGTDLQGKQGAESEEPSLLSKIFDTLSGTMYTAESTLNDIVDFSKEHHDKEDSNPLTDIFGPAVTGIGSAIKHIAGTGARNVGNMLDITSQVTGLEKAPGIGGVLGKVEDSFQDVGDKLTPRTMGHDVLENIGVKNKIAKYGGGFALDIATDPLTYVTFGGASAARKGAQEALTTKAATTFDPTQFGPLRSIETGEKLPAGNPLVRPKVNFTPVAEDALGANLVPHAAPGVRRINSATDILPNPLPVTEQFNPSDLVQNILNNTDDLTAVKAMRRQDNARRAAEVRWGRDPDKLDAADWTTQERGAFADFMRDKKMAKAGKVTDGKGNVSQTGIANVLDSIKTGTLPRFGPEPVAATGVHAELAKQVADEFAQNLTKASRKGRTVAELTPADQANLFNSLRNAAARTVNENAAAKQAERAAKPLSNRQQVFYDDAVEWSKQGVSEAEIRNYIDAGVNNGAITKTDGKAILRKFFPPQGIKNPAVTQMGSAAVTQTARQMLKTAEDHLIANGHNPVYWNGMRVRLSDVLEEVGADVSDEYLTKVMGAMVTKNTKDITDPAVRETIERALARRSLSMSDLLGSLSQKTLQVKKSVEDSWNLPKPVVDDILSKLPDAAADSVASRGATLAESAASKEYIKGIIGADKLPIDRFYDTVGPDLANSVLAGTVSKAEKAKINKLIAKSVYGDNYDFMTNITGHGVVDGFMTRFSTYFGRQAEMKRYSQDVFAFAEENAAYRTQFLRGITRDFTPEQRARGMLLAQHPEKLVEGETDQGALQVYNILNDYFDWMLGSTGFNKITDLNGSAAVRSGMVMTDVNKHLKAIGSKFYFIDKRVPSHFDGTIQDYSAKGKGWLRSWENASPTAAGQDPVSLLHDIDLAMQRTVAEYNTFDEFAMRFGSLEKTSTHTATIPNPRLQGYYFPQETRDQFLRLIGDLEKGAWTPKSKAIRMAMQGTRAWKSSVTIYYPVHHIRNLIGDSFNMWLAGVNDPRVFTKAARVLESQKSRYAEALKSHDMDMLKNLIDTEALGLTARAPKATDTIISNKRGVQLSAEQLWASGFQRGLFRGYNKIEDLFGETPMGAMMKTSPENSVMRKLSAPFGGRAHHVAAKVSEHREHYVRMAHYIGAIEKRIKNQGPKADLQKIFDDAAHEVRKWHPDGTDLTQFEQKLRIAIPFYAWTRKEIPLLAQAMVQKPAKIAAYPKAQYAVAGASGIEMDESQGLLDPYPNNQLFPEWIRATGIGPVGNPESDNPVAKFWAKFGAKKMGVNGEQGYVSINPSNPFNDVVTQLFGFGNPENSLRGLSNSLNPALGIPVDLFSNTTFSGAPITGEYGKGYLDYFKSQIPQTGTLDRLFGGPNNETTVDQRQQAMINFLTALGIRGTGPYEKSAEFEARARMKQ